MSRQKAESSGQWAVGSEQKEAIAPAFLRRSLPTALLLVGLSAMFLISVLWRPADQPTFILCPFRALIGLPCPGCGLTRAFCAIGHGELWRAIRFNAFSPLLYVVALLAWVYAAAKLLGFERVRAALASLIPGMKASRWLLAVVLVWWVVRLAGGFWE